MTRNLKTRIRRLETWTDKKRFTLPEDGLSEIDQTIASALIEIIEKRFAENGDHRFAMVLCTEVLERTQQMAPKTARKFTEVNVGTLCRQLIAESSGGTVVFLGYPGSEF